MGRGLNNTTLDFGWHGGTLCMGRRLLECIEGIRAASTKRVTVSLFILWLSTCRAHLRWVDYSNHSALAVPNLSAVEPDGFGIVNRQDVDLGLVEMSERPPDCGIELTNVPTRYYQGRIHCRSC